MSKIINFPDGGDDDNSGDITVNSNTGAYIITLTATWTDENGKVIVEPTK